MKTWTGNSLAILACPGQAQGSSLTPQPTPSLHTPLAVTFHQVLLGEVYLRTYTSLQPSPVTCCEHFSRLDKYNFLKNEKILFIRRPRTSHGKRQAIIGFWRCQIPQGGMMLPVSAVFPNVLD